MHKDDVALLERNVRRKSAVHQEVIDIHRRHLLAVTHQLYVPEASQGIDSSGAIYRMIQVGQGGQIVCSRHYHLTHDVHLDSPYTSESKLHLRLWIVSCYRIDLVELPAHKAVSLLHRHPRQIDNPDIIYVDEPVRRDSLADSRLVGPPDIDDNLITGPEPVVLRGSQILARGESQIPAGKNVMPIDKPY